MLVNAFINKRPYAILLLIILASALMQGLMAASKTDITHDETISYLSAVGKQGDFERIVRENAFPANHWATVGEWQAWFSIETPFVFGQIGRDLAESDIHPPLFFWLLHVWTWLFGVHAWTGPTLNMALQVAGAWGLFMLARDALKDTQEALVVTLVWAVSPVVLTAVLEARQYSLLGVCTIFFVWLMVRIVAQDGPRRWAQWLLLALATAAGALTHFHFILVVAGAGLVFLFKLLRRDFQRVLFVGTAVLTGYLIFFLLHPSFLLSIQELSRRQALEAKYLSDMVAILQRIYAVGNTFTRFWTIFPIAQVILFCLALTSFIWLGLVLIKNPARLRQFVHTTNLTGYEVGLFFGWMATVSILLYLSFISPIHAMTARHMSAVWPFFPFLPILLLRTFPAKTRYWLLGAVGTAVFFSGIVAVWQDIQATQLPSAQNPAVVTGKNVVVDGVYQGILPRIFLDLPPETLLFVATQEELLADPDPWLSKLGDNDLYISESSYDNTNANRDEILILLATRFTVNTVPGDSWSVGRRYFLTLQN